MARWPASRAATITCSSTSLAPHSTIRIASFVPAMRRSRSERSISAKVGLKTKSPSIRPTRTAPTGPPKGMSEIVSAIEAPLMSSTSTGFSPSDERAVQQNLDVVAHVLGEQRPQRAVGQARREDGGLRRTAFAAEERAGDAPAGVQPLFIVDRKGKEIDAFARRLAHRRRGEDHRVGQSDGDRPARLHGELAGLDRQRLVADGSLELTCLLHEKTLREGALRGSGTGGRPSGKPRWTISNSQRPAGVRALNVPRIGKRRSAFDQRLRATGGSPNPTPSPSSSLLAADAQSLGESQVGGGVHASDVGQVTPALTDQA